MWLNWWIIKRVNSKVFQIPLPFKACFLQAWHSYYTKGLFLLMQPVCLSLDHADWWCKQKTERIIFFKSQVFFPRIFIIHITKTAIEFSQEVIRTFSFRQFCLNEHNSVITLPGLVVSWTPLINVGWKNIFQILSLLDSVTLLLDSSVLWVQWLCCNCFIVFF